LTIVIRGGAGTTSLSDLSTFAADCNIHLIVLHSSTSVAQQLQKPFAEAEDGDLMLIYCQVSERHEAVLHMLGIRARSAASSSA
jgi:hypothetical protein